jgi:hypothetical protein
MAKAQSIRQFPTDIDRNYFGAWLSGFVDGEGCFSVEVRNHGQTGHLSPRATFKMTLRADDRAVLDLIRSYLNCGGVSDPRIAGGNRNPICTFSITSIVANANFVVPQFERFPLLAKKRRDFEIWKSAVALCLIVRSRPSQKRSGFNTGWSSRWQKHEIEQMMDYLNALTALRKYDAIAAPIKPPSVHDEQSWLF